MVRWEVRFLLDSLVVSSVVGIGDFLLKEFFSLVFSFNIKGLMIEPTSNIVIQAFRSLFVGAIAFVADAGLLWIISLTGLHYLICAVFGFLLGVYVNYWLSVKFVFTNKATLGKPGELVVYVIVGAVGLGLTMFFMWFFTEIAGLHFILSKCIATILVFVWNFTSRKVILYRNG